MTTKWLWGQVLAGLLAPALSFSAQVPTVPSSKIWDAAPHNAFTDLVRFKDRWLCVFREGKAHVSPDGAIRVIESKDGTNWTSAAVLRDSKSDLRDPKLTITPDGRLMLTTAGALRQPAKAKHQTMAWFSSDARTWSEPVEIGEPNLWLWRVAWHKGTAYGVGYVTDKVFEKDGTEITNKFVRLYRSRDGRHFEILQANLFSEGYPNETALLFDAEDNFYCLLRRDGSPASGQLGIARPPYKEWTWEDLGAKIGGPQMLQLPDGRFLAGVRLYDGGARTSLAWIDPKNGALSEFVKLPSKGDSSYPGLVWHDDLLWMSYYSSHEGKTSIYFARVPIPRS